MLVRRFFPARFLRLIIASVPPFCSLFVYGDEYYASETLSSVQAIESDVDNILVAQDHIWDNLDTLLANILLYGGIDEDEWDGNRGALYVNLYRALNESGLFDDIQTLESVATNFYKRLQLVFSGVDSYIGSRERGLISALNSWRSYSGTWANLSDLEYLMSAAGINNLPVYMQRNIMSVPNMRSASINAGNIMRDRFLASGTLDLSGTSGGYQTNNFFPAELEQLRWLYTVSNTAPYVSLLPKRGDSAHSLGWESDRFGDLTYDPESGQLAASYLDLSPWRSANPSQIYFTDWLADALKSEWSWSRVWWGDQISILSNALASISLDGEGDPPDIEELSPLPDEEDFPDYDELLPRDEYDNIDVDEWGVNTQQIQDDYQRLSDLYLSIIDDDGGSENPFLIVIPKCNIYDQYTDIRLDLSEHIDESSIRKVFRICWNLVGVLGLFFEFRWFLKICVQGL